MVVVVQGSEKVNSEVQASTSQKRAIKAKFTDSNENSGLTVGEASPHLFREVVNYLIISIMKVLATDPWATNDNC